MVVLYVRFAKLGTQVSEFLRAGSFLAAERLDLNNAGCNPVYHTGLSSPTTEWLNMHESNNTSINNSTTNVVDKTTFHVTTGLYPALFKFKHSVLFAVQFISSII